jgi:excinuclease ABC subunit C
MTPDETLQKKIDDTPLDPGVYLWKDATGRVIYVGKAKALRHRVRQYFQRIEEKDPKTQLLLRHIADLDWIVVGSEKEALILEATLIKKYFPRYNVRLRDDKRFISLRLGMNHPFPRLYVARKAKRDGSFYFGPFSDARAARETLRFIDSAFMLRKCEDANFASRQRPCLQYQIRRCYAPCVGYIDGPQYAALVDEVKLFFAGRLQDLLPSLREQMADQSAALEFEAAGRLRDRIQAIERTLEKQHAQAHGRGDRDVYGLHRAGAALVIAQVFVRSGAIVGQRVYPFKNIEDDDAQALRQLIGVYYTGDNVVPAQVLLPVEPEGGSEPLADWLGDLAGRKVEVRVAQRGEGRDLVEIAEANARRHFEARRSSLLAAADVLADLQDKLQLPSAPEVIECFDISNVHGKQAVASQVRFTQGEPDKSGYRRYRIRLKEESDDVGMMREALTRRLTRGVRESDLPDLLLVDGGRGQLHAAMAVLDDVCPTGLPVAAITKIKDLAPGEVAAKDKVYLPGRKNAVTFRAESHALHLLQRIRDEAHRFAIAYHRLLRAKKFTASELDEIPGVGPEKKKNLLKHFGSLKRVREAAVAELAEAPGIGPELAQAIHSHLHDHA